MPKWTEAQQKTIDTRDKNILVSAAAGSGKTAVLVERIKTLVIDEKADIDSFLITTFTKAASEEMRQRLEGAIRDELAACSGEGGGEDGKGAEYRSYLLRQLQILPGAAIGTFHSFALDIIRQYFYLTDLEPGFSIVDEVQQAIMKKDAVDKVFENRYEEASEEFFDFLKKHSSDRNDNQLKDKIVKTYNSLRSVPHYMEWAKERIDLMAGDDPAKAMGLTDFIRKETERDVAKACEYLRKAADILQLMQLESLYEKADEDAARTEAFLTEEHDFEETRQFLGAKFNRMSAKKDEKEAYETIKSQVGDLRDTGKKLLTDLRDKYYLRGMDEYNGEINAVHHDTEFFLGLIEEFEQEYRHAKAEENVIDMDDVMHYAIDILEDEKAAAEQRERFRYIFVDEYQDSNMLQETIVNRIARGDNLFMVGDVKQSIYKFRLAEPEIFMDKAKAYSSDGDEDSMVIDLNSNFRSKSAVTGSVNAVFREVMPGYDENAELHCMMPDEYPGHNTGLHIVNREDFGDDGPEKGETEAEIAAKIIRDSVGTEIYDFKKKAIRKVEYRDIAVLARAGNTVAEIERYLNNEGIPAYGDTGEGYFETVEIQVFLNLLRVIDNMRQDVPLISVMRSAVFGFSVREMAKIRINKRDGSFCAAVREYMNSGPDRELRQKLTAMDEQISLWKETGRTVPLEELTRMLLYDTGYYDYCSGLPVGRQRVSNLQLIVEKAAKFEKSSHSGLNGFLRYIEAMAESSTSEAEAKTISESENVVRVMTVHKSKGLEFPVVIFTGAGRQISGGGGKLTAPMHKDFGIALQLINREEHWKKKTLLQNVISAKQSAENLDEAVRILYVAMTRAMDRLDIVGSIEKTEKLRDVAGTSSYLDMIYASLRDRDFVDVIMYDKAEYKEDEFVHKNRAKDLISLLENETEGNDELSREIDRRLSYEYGHDGEVPSRLKYSVTELAREDAGKGGEPYPVPVAEFDPDESRHRLSAAEVGTVMHLVMEKIDFAKALAGGAAYVEEVAERLMAGGRISAEERAAVNADNIAGFFDTEIGRRAAGAFARGKLYKEKEFILDREINGQAAVVQGIIDCWFEEDDGLVLIDYKNSYVGAGRTTEDIKETYKGQIDIYREALEGATGRKVKESYLFLFEMGKFLEIE